MPRSNRYKKLLEDNYDGDINKYLKDNLIQVFEKIPHADSSIWDELPVGIEEFCSKWIGEPLYPRQLKAAIACFGTEPLIWDSKFYWFLLQWGKGGGKDRTVAKLMAYCAYKLICMKNHQKYFGQGVGQSFDLINVSINARQAKVVFFKQLKNIVRACINPKTKKNWFEEHGADLREHEDVQSIEINLPKGITCHSLNSEVYTGEGLCIFFAVLDEKGGMKNGKGIELSENIQDTIDSRFADYHGVAKLIELSFMYHYNDDMDITYRRTEGMEGVYRDKAATWEVNPKKKKEDYAKTYKKNLTRAKMTFECIAAEGGGDAIPDKLAIDECFNHSDYNKNPVIGNIMLTDNLFALRFHEWFRDDGKLHTVGIDLGKGKEKGCNAGLVMAHPEWMFPKYTRTKDDILTEKEIEEIEKSQKTGVVADLMLAIKAPEKGEIRMSDVRRFIIDVLIGKFGFRIAYITYDGYGSLESVQEFQYSGIRCEQRSVEDNQSQETLIDDFIGNRIFKTYRHDIWRREARNLIREEETAQINHPEKDYDRLVLEGKEDGSDDVWKASVQALLNCTQKLKLGRGVVF